MTQYINKSAVVAEIERRIKIHHDYGHYNAEQEFTKVLSFLDTLEMKEVDLEKEMSEYFVEHPDEFFSDKYKLFAKHFFELGLKYKKWINYG